MIEVCLKMRQYLCRVFYGITYCYAFLRVQTLRRNTSNPILLRQCAWNCKDKKEARKYSKTEKQDDALQYICLYHNSFTLCALVN